MLSKSDLKLKEVDKAVDDFSRVLSIEKTKRRNDEIMWQNKSFENQVHSGWGSPDMGLLSSRSLGSVIVLNLTPAIIEIGFAT